MLRAKRQKPALQMRRLPLEKQVDFWNLEGQFTGFIGGVGSGKTFAGALKCLTMPPNSTGMIVAPDYQMMTTTTLPALLEAIAGTGIVKRESKQKRYIDLAGNRRIYYRSAHDPKKLRGPNLGWFWIDEAAFIKQEAWRIIAGRLRKDPGFGWISTTPKGKKHWLYSELVATGLLNYVTSSSRENTYNIGTFASMVETIGAPNWIRQEAFGEFIEELGNVFRREWFPLVDRLPNVPRLPARAWDCAATPGGGDFTASIRGDLIEGVIYLSNEVRGQWGPGEVDAIQRQTARVDGAAVPIILEQEGGSSGKRVNHYVRTSLPGHTVIDMPASGSKYQRAIPFAKMAAEGRIVLVNGPWVADWLEEVVNFTGEETRKRKSDFGDELPVLPDDRIDAASMVVNYLMPFLGAGAYGGLDA